jgi:response regulator NasT
VKILLADDDAARAADLARAFAQDAGITVVPLAAGALVADAAALHAPDVILMDMGRPDRDALDSVLQLSVSQPLPVVLFVDRDDPAFMEAAIGAGVCSYNVGSVSAAEVKPVLRAAVALFRQHAATRAALQEAEARLRERATLDRAKAILMRTRRIGEPQAHRWLQRRAMACGRRIADVAREIVEQAEGGSR